MAAEALVLFLDEKNQKSSQPKCFFAAQGLCPAPKEPLWGKAGKTTGYGLLRLRKPQLCKIPDALSHAQGHQFYLLSPEAVRLTLWYRTNI
jgi:hypothetical protein